LPPGACQATPRDRLVLAGVVQAVLLLGLLASRISAQRALSIDPVFLLRCRSVQWQALNRAIVVRDASLEKSEACTREFRSSSRTTT